MHDRLPAPVRLVAAMSATVVPDRPARASLRALADAAVTADRAGVDALVIRGSDPAGRPAVEPIGLLAVAAARTVALGLVAEASPASCPPGHLARELATLDLLSTGRAGLLLDDVGGPDAEDYLATLRRHFHGDPECHPVVLTTWTPSTADCHVSDGSDSAPPPYLRSLTLPRTPSADPEVSAAASADLLEKLIRSERPYGLLLDFPAGPASLEVFTRLTLPLLRERRVLPPRAERVRQTLRDRLGLTRPAHASGAGAVTR
ncbi:LLM class flavin-dependent oxidoreductase [Streptomyces sp. NBC_00151]|jgi:alkanesulfonate monooxygenase SsuD/methylene tetrahydromethanopterin reductase-like flavin-dependent oxidoreductase (luciferase family)|uniref:LLM class flavin-dependent oxidoreductase n=1 Tax=Streptomyces sp. NBC_00151 TaxID=2975669 RepID=UPI002DDC1074|nr:LLM class flavin-dependent oxidoreductase [Streptomyces sp. NBC_00151]WRZ36850.1 LLM class flavin-dependent oxidoreductase [Streptomyces sp. NBC_00151]WRZ44728.1 LLM class flavin-dependent oxidoreductase [Streptomyces sp. NBC_00151]